MGEKPCEFLAKKILVLVSQEDLRHIDLSDASEYLKRVVDFCFWNDFNESGFAGHLVSFSDLILFPYWAKQWTDPSDAGRRGRWNDKSLNALRQQFREPSTWIFLLPSPEYCKTFDHTYEECLKDTLDLVTTITGLSIRPRILVKPKYNLDFSEDMTNAQEQSLKDYLGFQRIKYELDLVNDASRPIQHKTLVSFQDLHNAGPYVLRLNQGNAVGLVLPADFSLIREQELWYLVRLVKTYSLAAVPCQDGTKVLSQPSPELEYDLEQQEWHKRPLPETQPCDEGGIRKFCGKVQVMLVVANKTELEAVLRRLKPINCRNGRIYFGNVGQETYHIGKFGSYRTVVVKTRIGASGVGGSTAALMDALDLFKPKVAIAVGVAFGNDSEKHKIADVLVSSQLIMYEPQRVGETECINRGAIPEASNLLLNLFQSAAPRWRFQRPDGRTVALIDGPILTGEKLVDDPSFKEELFQRYPQAIGGEMEGSGLYAAATRKETHWLVVKAICDWGQGKADRHQALAAAAAVDLTHYVMSIPHVLGHLDHRRYLSGRIIVATGVLVIMSILAIAFWTQKSTERVPESRSISRETALQVEQFLDKAWNLLGGEEGLPRIYRPTTDRGKLEKARDEIEKALTLDPDSIKARRYMAIYLEGIGRRDKAIKALRELLEKDRLNDPKVMGDLAGLLRQDRQLHEAGELVEKALRLEPDNPALYINLGITRKMQGRLDDAEIALRKAVELDKMDAYAHFYLAQVLAELGRKKESESEGNTAIALRPELASEATHP